MTSEYPLKFATDRVHSSPPVTGSERMLRFLILRSNASINAHTEAMSIIRKASEACQGVGTDYRLCHAVRGLGVTWVQLGDQHFSTSIPHAGHVTLQPTIHRVGETRGSVTITIARDMG